MTATWTVILEGTTKEEAREALTFEMVDHKEFTLTPIAIKEDWLDAVLSIAATTEKYRVKSVLKTVLGPQQENFKNRNVLFVYVLLKKNAIPLAFLLGALKDSGYMVLSLWPPQFVGIVRQHHDKETVLSILIQIAKNPEIFEFINICYWVTREHGAFPPPYAA